MVARCQSKYHKAEMQIPLRTSVFRGPRFSSEQGPVPVKWACKQLIFSVSPHNRLQKTLYENVPCSFMLQFLCLYPIFNILYNSCFW